METIPNCTKLPCLDRSFICVHIHAKNEDQIGKQATDFGKYAHEGKYGADHLDPGPSLADNNLTAKLFRSVSRFDVRPYRFCFV